jgi:hypothetical protein
MYAGFMRTTRARALQTWLWNPASLALLSAVFLAACEKGPPAPGAAESTLTNAATNLSEPRPEYARLTGKWERPDGGYVLEIRRVDAGGVMDAGYFNPAPIHVANARAIHDSEGTKVFVELRDVQYPGCTYSLKYDRQTDQLFGEYYQAALQRTYDVVFARLP